MATLAAGQRRQVNKCEPSAIAKEACALGQLLAILNTFFFMILDLFNLFIYFRVCGYYSRFN